MSVSVYVWYLCVRRGSKYFKVVSDWLTLVADLGTIFVGGPLWTQFRDVVVLAMVLDLVFQFFSKSSTFLCSQSKL